MNIKQIKKAIQEKQIVHWVNPDFVVVQDNHRQYLIRNLITDQYISLTNVHGNELNGEEHEFYTIPIL